MTENILSPPLYAKGLVKKAFGNLLQVEFEGDIQQGEIAMVHVEELQLKAEVIEIIGQEAKLQVYEDTRGIKLNTPVTFTKTLLEAELGPGLLSTIFDGLQNPLAEIAEVAGVFLPKGIYLSALDRKKHWPFTPVAKEGQILKRGDVIGTTMEGRFTHFIMLPFIFYGNYTLTWIVAPGSYSVDTVIAKVKDEQGQECALTMMQRWPVKKNLIEGERIKPSKMMVTGERIIDTQFPLVKGGTFCIPGPFGAGKTVLQQHLSKYADVDLVVFIACGERAGEVVEVLKEFPHLIDPHTGETLMKRTVIICNTSSMPVAARESSVYLGITIAEYYRQMGLDILVLADSTSRWAQALREISGRLEEIPGEEAFPAYLSSRIAEFYERSGVLALKNNKTGSITIGGAVSPAGGNFEEPVTQATLAKVGAFLGLSRDRANARRFPAIDPEISWSSYLPLISAELAAKDPAWEQKIKFAQAILKQGSEINKRMQVIGKEGILIEDLIIYLKAVLYDFSYLQQNAFDKEDAYCTFERQLALFDLMHTIFKTKFTFTSHEEAREFFMLLQNKIKNMNFTPFHSEIYQKAYQEIEVIIKERE